MTFRRTLRAIPLLALCSLPSRAAAQQTPEQVAVTYYDHFIEGRLNELAALTHPRALESFKGTILAAMEQDPSQDEGNPTADELRRMPADSVYLWAIGAAPEESRLAALMVDWRMEPLGHLPQGDSVAHVVYVGRGSVGGAQVAQTMAMTLRRHQDRWLVDPGDGLLGMLGSSVMYLMLAATMESRAGRTAEPHP